MGATCVPKVLRGRVGQRCHTAGVSKRHSAGEDGMDPNNLRQRSQKSQKAACETGLGGDTQHEEAPERGRNVECVHDAERGRNSSRSTELMSSSVRHAIDPRATRAASNSRMTDG